MGVYLIGVDIASCPDGHNMGVVSEHGIQHWTVVLPFTVLCKVQLDQGLPIKFLSSTGIHPILLKPGNNASANTLFCLPKSLLEKLRSRGRVSWSINPCLGYFSIAMISHHHRRNL